MVLTKSELVASLQNEVRIVLHLAGKIDRQQLAYRPTPNQRSTLDLMRYLTIMGPQLLNASLKGEFDVPAWTAAETAASTMDLDQCVAAIASHAGTYASMLANTSDADFRAEIAVFGAKSSRGSFIVDQVLCGCAAYRTQLFLYLKASGRPELSTMNLWAGMDPRPAA